MSAIIAIDGPAGSGKSSVSQEVARRRGYGYLDTGAAYRVLTLACLESGVNLEREPEVVAIWKSLAITPPIDPDAQQFILRGEDVSGTIREEWVSAEVSRVARHRAVREALNAEFRRVAAQSSLPAIVIEGRDITTVVAPEAPVRILLTADEAVRIGRRAKELGGEASGLAERDSRDSKVVDFLRPAEGVTLVDSTDLDFDHTVQAVLDVIDSNLGPQQGGVQ
jgi:cytidylate kinase